MIVLRIYLLSMMLNVIKDLTYSRWISIAFLDKMVKTRFKRDNTTKFQGEDMERSVKQPRIESAGSE